MDHVYSAEFYEYINAGARRSARRIIPLLQSVARIGSVLDVGAGQGAWAAEWLAAGSDRVIAVDGAYVRQGNLLIPANCFASHDLSQPLDLGEKFDLVQSLEVAEHIDADRADAFVDTLTAHGDLVLFSAAVPNQGGEHHVNEQPPEYWRRKFAARGYAAFDWLRPRLRGVSDVEAWYRFNCILYANAAGATRLGADARAARVADNVPLAIGGSLGWHARRALVSVLPADMVNWVAMANATRKARTARRLAA